jgi:hypothetical protein
MTVVFQKKFFLANKPNSLKNLGIKIPKSFEVSGLIASIQLLPSFRVPVDGDLVQSFGLA